MLPLHLLRPLFGHHPLPNRPTSTSAEFELMQSSSHVPCACRRNARAPPSSYRSPGLRPASTHVASELLTNYGKPGDERRSGKRRRRERNQEDLIQVARRNALTQQYERQEQAEVDLLPAASLIWPQDQLMSPPHDGAATAALDLDLLAAPRAFRRK